MLLNLHSFTWFQHYVLNISGTPGVCNYSITLQIFLLGQAGIACFDPPGKLQFHYSFTVETWFAPDLMIMILFFLERRRMRKVPMQLLRITSRRQM